MTRLTKLLQSLKYAIYYWSRLHVRKKSLKRFWNKKLWWISWFVCSKWYIFGRLYIWQALEYISWNIWIWSCSFFFAAPRLVWRPTLRKQEKLGLLSDTDVSLMVENSIRAGTCHAFHWCAKPNNNNIKDYDKNRKSSKIYAWAMPQKLPLGGFK